MLENSKVFQLSSTSLFSEGKQPFSIQQFYKCVLPEKRWTGDPGWWWEWSGRWSTGTLWGQIIRFNLVLCQSGGIQNSYIGHALYKKK